MIHTKSTYPSVLPLLSSMGLMLLLLWLTVSVPIVYQARQNIVTKGLVNLGDEGNPFAGATEEKAPKSPTVSVSEEYIHHHTYCLAAPFLQMSNAYIHAHEPLYIAFHGELLCPPPNLS